MEIRNLLESAEEILVISKGINPNLESSVVRLDRDYGKEFFLKKVFNSLGYRDNELRDIFEGKFINENGFCNYNLGKNAGQKIADIFRKDIKFYNYVNDIGKEHVVLSERNYKPKKFIFIFPVLVSP